MRTLIIAFALMTTVGLSAQNKNQPQVSVSGEGVVKVVPDQAKIRVRVENSGTSAQHVKKENDKAVDAVLKFIKSTGISQKDYKTDYVNLNKQVDYKTKDTTYNAQQAISITLRDLKRYDKLMNGLLDSGINRIDGVSFIDSKLKEHQKEARQKAAKNALEKAKDYAEVLGAKVGAVQSIQEAGSNTPSPRPTIMMKAMSADTARQSQETLAAGEIEIKQQVQVRFALEQ